MLKWKFNLESFRIGLQPVTFPYLLMIEIREVQQLQTCNKGKSTIKSTLLMFNVGTIFSQYHVEEGSINLLWKSTSSTSEHRKMLIMFISPAS